MKTLNSD